MTKLISIVSPVYGCSECLEELYEKVKSAFPNNNLEWELILVDDRGPDDPWSTITKLSKIDHRVKGIRLSKNSGQHMAIWVGLQNSNGDWVAVIDCDLQDDPSIIPELFSTAIDQKVEAVIVNRGSWSDTWFRRAASRIFYNIVNLLAGVKLENSGNFGLYSKNMVQALLTFEEQEVFLPMMVALTGFKTERFKLDRSGRAVGTSSYSFWRLMRLASSIIIRFSDRPLKLSILVGFSFSMLSGLASIFLIISWALGALSVPGWASTVLSIWFLSGLILATLGIQGFYIGRVFAEVKKRPRFIIENTTKNKSHQIE